MSEGSTRRPDIRLIGIGNRWRGDDAAGLVAAERARPLVPAGVTVIQVEGEPVSLLDSWDGADAAIVIDAVSSGARPGTVHRVDAHADPLPVPLAGPSTHTLGLGEAIELGRVLDRLPARLTVIGVEGRRFEASNELSIAVGAAIEAAVSAALDAVAASRTREPLHLEWGP